MSGTGNGRAHRADCREVAAQFRSWRFIGESRYCVLKSLAADGLSTFPTLTLQVPE